MRADSNVAPVIIKRKKVVVEGGHHGGAWKVAYADFVTAMMAFFMLMWLLNATTEKQRKGIADYFSPTIALARVSGGGDGALGGETVFAENVLPRNGTGSTSTSAQVENGARGAMSGALDPEQQAEEERLKSVEDALMARAGESSVSDDLREHIVTRVTDEGLVVELFETADARLFEGDDRPTSLLQALAGVVASAADIVTNPVAVEGHVMAFPIVRRDDPAWDVSGLRATAFREILVRDGLEPRRVQRVTAHADREPVRSNPMDIRNNRIEIVFIRQR